MLRKIWVEKSQEKGSQQTAGELCTWFLPKRKTINDIKTLTVTNNVIFPKNIFQKSH